MDEGEVLDLVDGQDRVAGTINRNDADKRSNTQFLRAAEVFIVNSHGQFWIPRRTMNKRIAPGGLDYSMGEHVKAGEDYMQSCPRGLAEELNINARPKDLKLIKKFLPNRIRAILELFTSINLMLNSNTTLMILAKPAG